MPDSAHPSCIRRNSAYRILSSPLASLTQAAARLQPDAQALYATQSKCPVSSSLSSDGEEVSLIHGIEREGQAPVVRSIRISTWIISNSRSLNGAIDGR